MLSRAADNLYWMARYIERAENMARMLDVSYRMSLMPSSDEPRTQWEPPLIIAGCDDGFAKTDLPLESHNVINYLALDAGNPSSIRRCIQAARENARAMRSEITTEMWESINSTWLEMREMEYSHLVGMGYSDFFDWVKERSHLFRGVTTGTMLREEAFHFVRLGTALERADATARLLDVKYHMLLPSPRDVGGLVDHYQWAALLRSVSALRAYRNTYRDSIKPAKVADLLILNPAMPRSIAASFEEITDTLFTLRDSYARDYSSTRMAFAMHSRLRFTRIEEIFAFGLHEFLTEQIDGNLKLGIAIARDFMGAADQLADQTQMQASA
ncbi:MAG: alpha-E domain-containing protein [Sneathiellaceae bacterium]